ncbi:MAG TPA: EAL domain-containing protein [Gammaproteobacteria bacterium]|nr:EAL domain-containing protein [Gammaproteobacteria bacterium]
MNDATLSKAAAEAPGGPRPDTLLLVDDEPHVCSSLARILRRDNYRVLTANSAEDALAVLAKNTVDVVLSDQRMPGKKGTELLAAVRDLYPNTVRLILSGAAEIQDITSAMGSGAIYKFLTKPIDPALLRANIAEAFSRAASLRTTETPGFAARDAATGLPTRAYLKRIFPSLVSGARSDGGSVCMLMLRVDQYPNIVASFGHQFGEEFVRAVAAVLSRGLAQHYFLCPDAPGNFLVLTTDDDPFDRIAHIERSMDELFSRPIPVLDHRITVTASVGATVSAEEEPQFDELVDQAHAAMMTASGRGGATMQLYQQHLVKALRGKLQLESDLREAVAARAFHLVYQPQVEITSGQIVGLEALLRWQHPERGLVSPKEFIPLAEELGLVNELGGWILNEVIGQLMRWRERGLAPQEVAINVSPVQLRDRASFVDKVAAALAWHALPPQCLVLEITESAAIEHNESISGCLADLRELGVTLAIDDFGTGYANLSNLTRFAFKKLKIDRSLLPQSRDERSRKLFANVVAMARELGLTVVAEGVETPNELATVAAARCAVVQGYFYSPPVSPEKLDALLSARFLEA